MSKAEILVELPRLRPDERREILDRLWELEERDIISGSGPTKEEKRLLESELLDFKQDPNAGSPWPETEARLRRK